MCTRVGMEGLIQRNVAGNEGGQSFPGAPKVSVVVSKGSTRRSCSLSKCNG